jgi:flagellar biogenesis protein FliO
MNTGNTIQVYSGEAVSAAELQARIPMSDRMNGVYVVMALFLAIALAVVVSYLLAKRFMRRIEE